jgi:hypothetical protein
MALVWNQIVNDRWGENCDGNINKHYYVYAGLDYNNVSNANPRVPGSITPICNLNAYETTNFVCIMPNSMAYFSTQYFWKVITGNGSSNSSSPVWNFTTNYYGTIKGYKVLMPGNSTANSTINSQPVNIGSAQKTDNPYSFLVAELPGGAYYVSVPQLANYNIGYTLCYNSTACHTGTPQNTYCLSGKCYADVVANSIGINGYADLWFHYTPNNYTISGNVYVDTDMNGSKNGSEANYGSAITVTSSGGSVSYPAPAGSYSVGSLVYGTYTVAFSLPAGYRATYPGGTPPSHSVIVGTGSCSVGGASTHGASCDANGNIANLNFGINNSYPWYQCKGADCRIDGTISNPIAIVSTPNYCLGTQVDPYMSVIGPNSNMHGITFCDDSYSFGNGEVSNTPKWLVTENVFTPANSSSIRTSYNYILNSVTQRGATTIDLATVCPDLTNCTLPNSLPSGIYTASAANSNVTIVNPLLLDIPTGKKIVILVNGDLNIEQNIKVAIGSTLTFSASGNINVNKNVTNLQGYYSADKSFVLEGDTGVSCPTKVDVMINIAGAVVVNAGLDPEGGYTFVNQRDLCSQNIFCPTYTFTERPDFLLNAHEILLHPNYLWREVAP